MSYAFSAVTAGRLAVAAAVMFAFGAGDAVQAQKGKEHEITVTIQKVRALDFNDWGLAGQADYYTKVTIAGETFTTTRIKGHNEISPNWKISKSVKPGKHDVKVQIFDKDVLKPDEYIDINRVSNKRDLDFTIDTRSCRVAGFSGGYKCGQTITRDGDQKKKAHIEFRVDVKK